MSTVLYFSLVLALLVQGGSYLTERKPYVGSICIGIALWLLLYAAIFG